MANAEDPFKARQRFKHLLEKSSVRQDVHIPRTELPRSQAAVFELVPPSAQHIVVPKQRRYTGFGAIPNDLARIPCADLGLDGLLEQLNRIHGTSYDIHVHSLKMHLLQCMARGWDFGMAYSHMRPLWENKDFEKLVFLFAPAFEAATALFRHYATTDDRVFVDPTGLVPFLPPRRLWDLYSNRVVRYPLVMHWPDNSRLIWRVSHAWVHPSQRRTVMTPINNYEWPVPLPVDVDLEQVRIELLNSGAEYAWLDVLCLRQEGRPEDDAERLEEWKVDIPSIGFVYTPPPRGTKQTNPEAYGRVACYFSGLGRPFVLEEGMLSDKRHWLNRAWTLQEHKHDMITLGITEASPTRDKPRLTKVVREFYSRLEMIPARPPPNAFAVLHNMQYRSSEDPVDKIGGLAYFLVTSKYFDGMPRYQPKENVEKAWHRLIVAMEDNYRLDLLFLYPSPGKGRMFWAPSWAQVLASNLSPLAAVPAAPRRQHFDRFSSTVSEVFSFLPDALSGIKKVVDAAPGFQVRELLRDKGELLTDGYVVESCAIRGLAALPEKNVVRAGYARVGGRDIVVRAPHREPIPDGRYMLVGRNGSGSEQWVIGKLTKRDERIISGETLWIKKVSVLRMPETSRREMAGMDPGSMSSLRFL